MKSISKKAAWDGIYRIPATEGGPANQWTWVKGSHTLEFSGDILWSKVINQNYEGDGSYTFSNVLFLETMRWIFCRASYLTLFMKICSV